MKSIIPEGKHRVIIIILLLVGIFLIVLGSVMPKEKETAEEIAESQITQTEKSLEKRIESICMTVNGIETATALVTVCPSDFVSAGSGFSSEAYTVRGVAVTVTNGDNPTVKRKITEMISSSLGILENKIAVAGAKSENEE